jgi:hypothetical protein
MYSTAVLYNLNTNYRGQLACAALFQKHADSEQYLVAVQAYSCFCCELNIPGWRSIRLLLLVLPEQREIFVST